MDIAVRRGDDGRRTDRGRGSRRDGKQCPRASKRSQESEMCREKKSKE